MPLPPPDPPLADGIVVLRQPEERDLPVIERGIRDAGVMRAFGTPTLTAAELLDLNRRRWADGSSATFAVCDAGEDACLGHVFVNLRDPATGTVGYWLLPEARGRGLATGAVRLVSGWALRDLGLARLGLLTEPGNVASQRVAERCGFKREGVLRSYAEIDTRRVDYVVFSLLPDELDRLSRRSGGTR